jgi:hypothetical protein
MVSYASKHVKNDLHVKNTWLKHVEDELYNISLKHVVKVLHALIHVKTRLFSFKHAWNMAKYDKKGQAFWNMAKTCWELLIMLWNMAIKACMLNETS